MEKTKRLSEEHKRNLSESMKGKNKGRKLSKETREKMSKSQRGRKIGKFSEEHKRKIRESNKGKPRTEEQRRKMSKAKEGRRYSKEHRRKMSESHKSENISGEYRRKLSKAHKGKKISRETREKMSSSKKGKNKGKKIPKEQRRKMRISQIEYMRKTNHFNVPVIGKYEKQILDKLQNIIGFSIKRQFYINGYFIDGYCQELNLAIEVDEEHHFEDNQLKDKDIVRQKEIIEALNCDFMRIKLEEVLNKKKNIDINELNKYLELIK